MLKHSFSPYYSIFSSYFRGTTQYCFSDGTTRRTGPWWRSWDPTCRFSIINGKYIGKVVTMVWLQKKKVMIWPTGIIKLKAVSCLSYLTGLIEQPCYWSRTNWFDFNNFLVHGQECKVEKKCSIGFNEIDFLCALSIRLKSNF